MQKEELVELIKNIKAVKSESNDIECKSASKGCPERLYGTLSSFSNQNDGGTIVFGVDERNGFRTCGVYDANDLIKKMTAQAKQMEPPVRALFTIAEIDGKTVVSMEIPSLDYQERPCFYKGLGKHQGSYIRIGDSDERMTESEIYSFEAYKKRIRDDARAIDEADLKLFDEDKYSRYLKAAKLERENLSRNVSDEEIAELMGLRKDGKPTLAMAMIFSKYPQAYFPQFSITAVVVPGKEIGDATDNGKRFLDNKRITGPIDEMLEEAMEFVIRNIKVSTVIDHNGRRSDQYEYPLLAIREAILNSLVHRDYSRYSEGKANRIEIYADRIEISNPGSLYGGIPVDNLGSTRPETRNVVLANVLETLKVTENRYSGIPTIKKELAKMGMPSPTFISKGDEFKIIIRKEFPKGSSSLAEKISSFCHEPKSRDEIASYIGLSKNHVMSKIIAPLVEKGVIGLTIPEKPHSSLQRYYAK